MTRPATHQIREYVMDLRNRMRLDAWDIDISNDPPKDPDDTLAETVRTYGRWHAIFRFHDAMFACDAEDQRQYFVHELLHLTHYELDTTIRNGEYRQQLGQALYNHLSDEFKHHLERMVDFNSRLVARSMPLPPWTSQP